MIHNRMYYNLFFTLKVFSFCFMSAISHAAEIDCPAASCGLGFSHIFPPPLLESQKPEQSVPSLEEDTSIPFTEAFLRLCPDALDIVFQYAGYSEMKNVERLEGPFQGHAAQSLSRMALDLREEEESFFKDYPRFKKFVSAYAASHSLQAILLENCRIDVKTIKILLMELPLSISYLDLSGVRLRPQMLKYFLHSPCLLGLQTLVVSGNNLGSAGALLLTQANWPHLTRLEMSKNGLGNKGMRCLSDGQWPLLTSMTLSKNGIGDKGAGFIAFANWPLQELDISNNRMSPLGVQIISTGKPLLTRFKRTDNRPAKDLSSHVAHTAHASFSPQPLLEKTFKGEPKNSEGKEKKRQKRPKKKTRLDFLAAVFDAQEALGMVDLISKIK